MAGRGTSFFLVGQSGATGGSTITYPTTGLLLSGGAGGASTTNNGSSVTAPASQAGVLNLFATLSGGIAGTPGGSGSPGVELLTPLLSCGGSGGGASTDGAAQGGFGGNGGFGSGGGGGGAGGTTGGSGGGGNGGPGLVLIYSW